MSVIDHDIEPLIAGDRLSRAEFFRRWEAAPKFKRAELIGGTVYMPPPVSLEHGDYHNMVNTWLGVYAAATPGCAAGDSSTWLMLDDAPQPDAHLRVLPLYGGRSRVHRGYARGAPELAAEVSHSTSAYDLHPKRELYQAAGVQEYLVVLLKEREVRWHRLVGGAYQRLRASRQGVCRSVVFPGLWLDVPAMLDERTARVLETLQVGLQSDEHARFVAQLARRKK